MIQWIDMVRASVACATIGRARMVTLALQVFNQPSSAHPNPRTVPVSRAESPILYSESNSPSQKSLFKWSVTECIQKVWLRNTQAMCLQKQHTFSHSRKAMSSSRRCSSSNRVKVGSSWGLWKQKNCDKIWLVRNSNLSFMRNAAYVEHFLWLQPARLDGFPKPT